MDIKITDSGNYPLNAGHSMSKSVVYLTGNLGGATVDLMGFGGKLIDGAMVLGTQYEVHHGVETPLNVLVTGGSGIDMTIRCVGIH